MTRLTRKNLKVFAYGASNNGVFGSLQANNPTKTNDVEQIQSLPAWENGWNSATESSEMLPPLEEAQALNYVGTYQTAYILQEGVPEWLSTCEYHTGSWVKSSAGGKNIVYESLVDSNVGNPVTDDSKWEPRPLDGGFVVGDLKESLQTANHENWFLCDGQAISRTTYSALFDLIGTTYGSGDGSTTFNLPDYSSIIHPTSSAVGVKGNGKNLGLTNGSGEYGIGAGISSSAYSVITSSTSEVTNGQNVTPQSFGGNVALGVSEDETKSGIIGSITSYVQMNYFIKAK